MTDRLDFETRFEERLRARAALASRPFDAAAIARRSVGASGRPRRLAWLGGHSNRPALRLLVVALLVTMAMVGAIAGGAVLLRERPLSPSLVSNGLIAVSANPVAVGAGEAGDIYLVQSGASARRIIGAVGDGIAQACPTFSPDGSRLAYGEGRAAPQPDDNPLRGRASVAERAVVVVGLTEGGDVTPPIARLPIAGTGPLTCPEWSPVGGQLAFRVGTELWVGDASSAEVKVFPVTAQSGFEQNELAWSRDGAFIAVAEPGRIRVVRTDDGSTTLVQVAGATPASLGWTAGDASIIYLATDEPGDGLAVHAVDANGMNDTQLLPGSADPQIGFDHAVTSPDGTRLAVLQRTYRCTTDGCSQDPARLVTMDLEGSSLVELAIPPDFGVSGLLWSPDGERLLIGSIDGVLSVAVAPGSAPIVYSSGQLNLEWSGSEVSWQPVLR